MKELVNMLAGGKNSTATSRAVVYSAFGTAIALMLVMAILIVSSIAFAVIDATTPDLEEDMDGGEKEPVIVSIEYTTLENISALKSKIDLKLVKIADGRTKMEAANNFYYAKNDKDGIDQLSSTAMKALDKMMLDFYDNKKSMLHTEYGKPECNIPLIANTDTAGTGFDITDINDQPLSANVALYGWITDNAYKYGFIHQNGSFRYVGVAVATQAKTFAGYETFLNSVKGSAAGAEMSLGRTYKAYYVAADAAEIKVPSNLSYEVFADGIDGYVVVVKTSK